jgi:hypothetical protein
VTTKEQFLAVVSLGCNTRRGFAHGSPALNERGKMKIVPTATKPGFILKIFFPL